MLFNCNDISSCLCVVMPTSFTCVFLYLSVSLILSITGILRWYSIIIPITLNGGSGSINVLYPAFSPKPWLLCLVWGSITAGSIKKKKSAVFSPWFKSLENWRSHSAVIFLQEIYESSREHVAWMGSLCVKLIHSTITVIGVRDLVRHKVLLEL